MENYTNMSFGPVDDDSAAGTVRNYYPCDSGLCTGSSRPGIGGWSAVTPVVHRIHTSYDYEELILDKGSSKQRGPQCVEAGASQCAADMIDPRKH